MRHVFDVQTRQAGSGFVVRFFTSPQPVFDGSFIVERISWDFDPIGVHFETVLRWFPLGVPSPSGPLAPILGVMDGPRAVIFPDVALVIPVSVGVFALAPSETKLWGLNFALPAGFPGGPLRVDMIGREVPAVAVE